MAHFSQPHPVSYETPYSNFTLAPPNSDDDQIDETIGMGPGGGGGGRGGGRGGGGGDWDRGSAGG